MEIKKYYVWQNRLHIGQNPPIDMDEMIEVCKYEDMKKLVEENEILKETVEFYADSENWEAVECMGSNLTAMNGDCGDKAKEALEKIKER